MRPRYALQKNTIRGRLWMGFGTIVILLAVAGVLVRGTFAGITETITASLADVQTEASLAASLPVDESLPLAESLAVASPGAVESPSEPSWTE